MGGPASKPDPPASRVDDTAPTACDVVLLCSESLSSRVVHHALQGRWPGRVVTIVEGRPPRGRQIRRRISRLGLATVLGQLAFLAAVAKPLAKLSKGRVDEILRDAGLSAVGFQGATRSVASVNETETHRLVSEIDPSVVVINGTRILSRETLESISAPVINTHHGITPAYRGVHGGYWALSQGRPDLAGTTIHYVDAGIDTGGVIRHVPLPTPTAADNFATYPVLHIASAVPALLDVCSQIVEHGQPPESIATDLPSRYYSHPTLWQYVAARLRSGVK